MISRFVQSLILAAWLLVLTVGGSPAIAEAWVAPPWIGGITMR